MRLARLANLKGRSETESVKVRDLQSIAAPCDDRRNPIEGEGTTALARLIYRRVPGSAAAHVPVTIANRLPR